MRKLYEETAVPVREIAGMAGVTERTIYKYARKGGWTPRYRWVDAGGVARRRRTKEQAQFAPVKGAGGRFVARSDKDKPFPRGLKATDPQGAKRAAAACAEADDVARAAESHVAEVRRDAARSRAIEQVNDALGQFNRYRKERKTPATEMERHADDLIERVFWQSVAVAVCEWERLLAEEAGGVPDAVQHEAKCSAALLIRDLSRHRV